MNVQRIISRISALTVGWLISLSPLAFGQDSASPAGPAEKQIENWDEARNRLEGLTATVTVKAEQQPLGFGNKPVLTFSDPTRKESTGTVWLIGEQGRPRAILSLFYNDVKDFWSYEFTSLSTDAVSVERPRKWRWKTEKTGLNLQKLNDRTAPALAPAGRMTQMKAIAREFSAAEVYFDGSRTELRLLAQPLIRYVDEQSGTIDGAMFAFTHGTNPELLLVIEAHQAEGDKAAWRYGAARMSSAELHLSFQQNEVWTAEIVRTYVETEPYYSRMESGAATKNDKPPKSQTTKPKPAE